MASYLKIDPADYYFRIKAALERLAVFAESYEWATGASLEQATENIIHLAGSDAYLIDGFLVMAEPVQPWWSKDKMLSEWLVLKVEQGDRHNVLPGLEQLARDLGCVAVMCNDSSGVNLMGKAYEAGGATPLTRAYYKKV